MITIKLAQLRNLASEIKVTGVQIAPIAAPTAEAANES